ncbi:MAG: ABC transporter ATP-binding protein [Clostridiales bacterium]|nr:ABC transporter ATP-binding protein [Clostridiales bacterium]
MSALLEISGLSVEIMTTRGLINPVREVDLTIEKGMAHGLVGESGCGKSVTARTILGLHERRLVRVKGKVMFEGKDLLSLSEKEMEKIRGRRIGMIFQDPVAALNPLFKIGDQIAEVFTRHFGDSRAAAKKKTLELLERVGIMPAEARYNQYPFEFSGGMLQRVVIAIAIAAGPPLVIADEPTTALDVTIQAQILDLLQELQRELGLAILLITHNFGIVSEMCDVVSVMYAGMIMETGNKNDVLLNPLNRYSKALIDSIPSRGAAGQAMRTIPGTPPELFDHYEGCPFAPRCETTMGICRSKRPQLEALAPAYGERHFAACHLPTFTFEKEAIGD